jgi:hypothetical protein
MDDGENAALQWGHVFQPGGGITSPSGLCCVSTSIAGESREPQFVFTSLEHIWPDELACMTDRKTS